MRVQGGREEAAGELSAEEIRRCNDALKRVYRAPGPQSLAEQFPFTGEALRQAFGDGSRPMVQKRAKGDK